MDLNKIKLLKKDELLQKLKQSGFSDVVSILEDKEINGEKFIELKEFEIFKWKLSSDEKKRLWKCISEIKANPFLLVAQGKPKLIKRPSLQRVGSFSENNNGTKLIKGKLEGLLGSVGATVGSAASLPNRNHPNIEATSTLPHWHTNVNTIEKDERGSVRYKPPAPPPAPPPTTGVGQPNKISQQPNNIKKPALPTPSKGWQTRSVKKPALPLPAENVNDDEYIEMQQPTQKTQPKPKGINVIQKESQPDDEYLTPREIEENDYEAPPNIADLKRSHMRNANFPAKGTSVKKVGIPSAPPLPNKSANNATKSTGNNKFNNSSFANSEGTFLPTLKISNPPNLPRPPLSPRSVSPSNRNSNNSLAGLNRKELPPSGGKATSNKYLVEVVTDEPEEENTYDNVDSEKESRTNQNIGRRQFPKNDNFHQSPPSKITPDKTRREQGIPINNEISEQSQVSITRKTSIRDLENVLIINDRETGLSKISSALTNIFKKNRSKNSYENHSIASETRAIRTISIKERPLPDVPPFITSETEEEKPSNRPTRITKRPLPGIPLVVPPETEEDNPSDRFAKPFPLPREDIAFSDPAESYVELTRDVPDQFLQSRRRKTEESPHRGTPQKENVDNPSRTNPDDNILEDDEEELPEYGNTTNNSNQTQQPSIQDQLASLLAQKLQERNLRINGRKLEEKSSDDDSEPEFDEDPSYGNVEEFVNPPGSNLKISNPIVNNPSVPSSYKRTSPTPIVFNNPQETHDDEDPSYGPVDDSINTFRANQFPIRNIPPAPISSSLFSNKSKSPTPITFNNPPEVDDDEAPSYDNVENSINAFRQQQSSLKTIPTRDESNGSNRKGKSIPIFKRPLPEVPKSTSNVTSKPSAAGKQLPTSNRELHTPPSSDEEPIDDGNLTYGNVEPEPTIRKTPAVIGNKASVVSKKQEDDIFRRSLPKPLTKSGARLNYEHYKGQAGRDKRTKTFNEPEEEELAEYTNTNLNEEPFFRNTDRKGAKALLRNLEDGAFLIRPGDTYPLVLTVKYRNKYYNLGIEKNSVGKIWLHAEEDSMSPEFSSLHDFVDYFIKKPVTFQEKNEVVEICLKPVLPKNLF